MLDDPSWSPSRLIDVHLERSRELLAEQAALCARLEHLRDALRSRDEIETLFETMEVLTMIEKYYTPEQLAQLAARREAMGEQAIKAVEQEWSQLFAQLKTHITAGTPANAPEVQALARRSQELVQMFTGGDPAIAASLGKMYAENPPQQVHPSFDPAIFAYLHAAVATL